MKFLLLLSGLISLASFASDPCNEILSSDASRSFELISLQASDLKFELANEPEFAQKWSVLEASSKAKLRPLPEGEFLYVVTSDEKVYFAPRMVRGKLQTHRSLIRSVMKNLGISDVEQLQFIGGGEWIAQEMQEYSPENRVINNRSGTLRPNTNHLSKTIDVFNKVFGTPMVQRYQAEDYSVIGKDHPLYIENEIFDPSHTILVVEKIGVDPFKSILQMDDPKAGFERVLYPKPEVANVFQPTKESTRKNGPALFTRKDFAVSAAFLKKLNLLRADGTVFLDVDDFLKYFAKQVSVNDEFLIQITAVEVEFLGTEALLVSNPVSANGEISNASDYHNQLLESVTDVLDKDRNTFFTSQGRFGIQIKKDRGSNELQVWELDQRIYRHGRPKPTCDFRFKLN